MKQKLLVIIGLLLIVNTTAVFPSSLVFKHNGAAVFASLSNGTMLVNNPPLVSNSTAPASSQGLIIKHTNIAKLWTISDVVNINSEMAPSPSTLPSGVLMLSKSANPMTTLANDAIYNGVPTGDQVLTLTKEDYYLEGMVNENDGAGLPLTNYYGFGDGRIEYTGTTEKKRFYIKDHLGSTREVINEDGTPVERVIYDAYGKMTEETILAGSELNAKDKFTGKEFDKEGENSTYGVQGIQLNYFGERYYDPDVVLWTSVDPANQFWNPYSYPGNPILAIDPDGCAIDPKTVNENQMSTFTKENYNTPAWDTYVKLACQDRVYSWDFVLTASLFMNEWGGNSTMGYFLSDFLVGWDARLAFSTKTSGNGPYGQVTYTIGTDGERVEFQGGGQGFSKAGKAAQSLVYNFSTNKTTTTTGLTIKAGPLSAGLRYNESTSGWRGAIDFRIYKIGENSEVKLQLRTPGINFK